MKEKQLFDDGNYSAVGIFSKIVDRHSLNIKQPRQNFSDLLKCRKRRNGWVQLTPQSMDSFVKPLVR